MEALEVFREIFADGLYSEEPEDSKLAQYYLDVSEQLVDRDPVDPDAAQGFDETAEQASGLLAFGLKNWELGDLDSAVRFFNAFEAVDLPDQMSAYKSLTARYLADRRLVAQITNRIRAWRVIHAKYNY